MPAPARYPNLSDSQIRNILQIGELSTYAKRQILKALDQIQGGGASTFLELTDTPSDYTGEAGQVVGVTVGEDGLEFVTASGVTSWIDLTDTDPTSYSGEAGRFVRVNSGETGLEFTDPPSGTDWGFWYNASEETLLALGNRYHVNADSLTCNLPTLNQADLTPDGQARDIFILTDISGLTLNLGGTGDFSNVYFAYNERTQGGPIDLPTDSLYHIIPVLVSDESTDLYWYVSTVYKSAKGEGNQETVIPVSSSGPQAITGNGNPSVSTYLTRVSSNGTNTGTLADGTHPGQKKKIHMISGSVGEYTLTITNFANGSTVTFEDTGQVAEFVWDGVQWYYIDGYEMVTGSGTGPTVA